MKNPLVVSVALATFNGEKFIQIQLDSICKQSQLPDELVICDDNSTDNTLEIVEEFSRNAPFAVKLIRNLQNQGFVTTFSKALEETSGDLVLLCDQDDFWFPEKIAHTCLTASQNPESMLLMNNAELVDGELNPSGFSTFGQMNSVAQKPQELVLGCCMAVRRELLDLCLPIPGDFPAHDVWLHEYASFLDSKLLIPEVLQYYRRHQKNETAHIVYSLKAIGKLDYTVDYYRKLFFSKKMDSLSQRISNNLLRINALKIAVSKATGSEKEKLKEARDMFKQEIEMLKIRLEISGMNFFQRIPFASKLLLAGRYKLGIKSFLRDILGNR